MKIFQLLILVSLISFNICDQSSYVQVLTVDNFDEFIKNNEFVLVEFYAPWCGHCQQLAPEYESAALELNSRESTIKLAKVDVTENEALGEQFSIEGYPTLIFFKSGIQIQYDGGRTAQQILQWVRSRAGPVSQLVDSVDVLQLIWSKNEFTVTFMGQKESDQYKSFMLIADQFVGQGQFVHTFNEEVAAAVQIAPLPALFVHERDENQNHQYTGNWDGEDISTFIQLNTISSLMTFDEKVAELIFSQNKPVLFLLYGEKELDQKALDSLVSVQKELKGKILLVKLDFTNEFAERISEFIGITANDSPQFFIMELGEDIVLKYLLKSSEYNTGVLLQFYQDYIDKKLTPTYRSQEIPETSTELPYSIVGKNFDEKVIQNDKDVVVEFYSSWCEKSQEFAPIFKQIAEELQVQKPDILVYKIEIVENEVPSFYSDSYPIIYYYKAGDKTNPVQYNGELTKEDIIMFINKNLNQQNGHDDL